MLHAKNAKHTIIGGTKMIDILNIKFPYIGEIIEFGKYHNLEKLDAIKGMM